MEKSVLIITPFFAPQSHAAVFRAYKLAKYLPQYGWKPYVVTTDTNYLYNEDPTLLSTLPSDVEIHRTRYIEPSLRGLRMALGGRDRSFKMLKAQGEIPAPPSENPIRSPRGAGRASRIYRDLLDAWGHSPDAHWPWKTSAIRKATDLIRQEHIPVILTSADPYTSHIIGAQLKRTTGVRWIADFRDPHTHSYLMHSQYSRVFNKQRKAERSAVEDADTITVAAESIALILTETYGLTGDHPIHFIPTGLDDELVRKPDIVSDDTSTTLVFAGEFLPTYGDEFFRIFARVLSRPDVAKMNVRLQFIGRRDVNMRRLTPYVQRYGLEESVDILDHMPQEKLYAHLTHAKAALLIPGRRARWWCLYAKLVDYLALLKPVIAIVPDLSEARMHLQRSGLGIFLDGSEDAAVERLSRFMLGTEPPPVPDEQYCEQFLVQSQVKAFVDVFERMLEKN